MQARTGYRGWIVSFTVAGVVTYFILAVEQDSRLGLPTEGQTQSSQLALGKGSHIGQSTPNSNSNAPTGIWVNRDPSIEVTLHSKPSPIQPARGSLENRTHHFGQSDTATSLSPPPEPVATVVLNAPTAIPEMVAISKSSADENDRLVSAIDRAFDVPVREVALQLPSSEASVPRLDDSRLSNLMPTSALVGQIPQPQALLRALAALRQSTEDVRAGMRVVGPAGPSGFNSIRISDSPVASLSALQQWIDAVEVRLSQLITEQGASPAKTQRVLDELLTLTSEAVVLSAELKTEELSVKLGAAAYALERRVRVWQAVTVCLQHGAENVASVTADHVARNRLHKTASAVAAQIQRTAEPMAWRTFLRIDDLLAWSESGDGDWLRGNELATQILTRLQWERLSPAQREFLNQPHFADLSRQLSPWAIQPIDYRQLLADIELLEDDPINRCRASLAQSVQVLRVSPQENQRAVAMAINDHYRNANIRLSVSGKLLERMMPTESFQTRPVRQRILGADTQGNSVVRTDLSIRLIPDATAWHLELGLVGDMQSATQSSKGPATFHQTSVAKINSTRTLRMDPTGLKVSADPTNVDTSQYLRSMSTNLDSMPVVGDFFRVMVREQFEQQRGVAQRIVRRLIAEETDQELDKQLHEKMGSAEKQMQSTLIGPLERLKLNPIIVSMNTSEERLTVRYRVASETQMSAHTARPRAPGDSLVSMQLHQSAINNAIGQLGLSDKSWTLSELSAKLAEVFDQSPWPLPPEVPGDISVRFAPTRPITVELVDGKLEMTLRIADLIHPERNLHFQRFIIKASYVPVASGMQAYLIRDGAVSVDGPRLRMTEKMPLRGIFGTVFSAHSTLNLVHSQWQSDPRAAGLAVSQVEVRDGWLSLAISDSSSPHAARMASHAEAEEAKLE